jgi:carbohydrate-selective porin OprB
VGLAVEIGTADIDLQAISAQKLEGTYWMLGPVLRWRLNDSGHPHHFHMLFMAGSTEHDEVGVLGQARLGLQFAVGERLSLGVSWGVMNIDLNNDQGIASERDRYYYLYGANMAYRF